MRESQIEKHLIKRVKELGGEVRKVKWIGRSFAPDRLVMLPGRPLFSTRMGYTKDRYSMPETTWIELKNPETIKTFPADARERAQAREHERMRKLGQHVVVIGTIEQVDELLK